MMKEKQKKKLHTRCVEVLVFDQKQIQTGVSETQIRVVAAQGIRVL